MSSPEIVSSVAGLGIEGCIAGPDKLINRLRADKRRRCEKSASLEGLRHTAQECFADADATKLAFETELSNAPEHNAVVWALLAASVESLNNASLEGREAVSWYRLGC
jgi:hypothetical protein